MKLMNKLLSIFKTFVFSKFCCNNSCSQPIAHAFPAFIFVGIMGSARNIFWAAIAFFKFIPLLVSVVFMAVEPGFSAQEYLPVTSQKIIKLREYSLDIEIVIDGGMNVDTIDEVKSLGADSYVVSSVIAKSNDIEEKILELKKSEMVGAFKNIFA